MTEKVFCIVTPESRAYYKAVCVSKEFLDKDHNIVHTTGTIPDGEVTEINAGSFTIKHFKQGKLDGKLEVINLADNSVTFSEEYENGKLMHVSEQPVSVSRTILPPVSSPNKPPVPPQGKVHTGTILKSTKDTRTFYVNGKQVAQETLSDKDASVEVLGQIPDGTVKEFTDGGQLKTQATYLNNKLHGELIRYDDMGRILSKETYKQGVLHGPASYNSYLLNAVLHRQCTYIGAQLEGPFTVTQKDGTVRERGQYHKGRLTGEHTTYYPNGTTEMQETLIDGKPTGERKFFYPSGELWYLETYENGRLEGERKEFFPDGTVRLTEFYSDGMLNGQRNIYAHDGNLIACEEYHWGNIIHNTEYRPL